MPVHSSRNKSEEKNFIENCLSQYFDKNNRGRGQWQGKEGINKKRGEVAVNNFTPEGHLILLSISTAYTLLRASDSKTTEKGNPYKLF